MLIFKNLKDVAPQEPTQLASPKGELAIQMGRHMDVSQIQTCESCIAGTRFHGNMPSSSFGGSHHTSTRIRVSSINPDGCPTKNLRKARKWAVPPPKTEHSQNDKLATPLLPPTSPELRPCQAAVRTHQEPAPACTHGTLPVFPAKLKPRNTMCM